MGHVRLRAEAIALLGGLLLVASTAVVGSVGDAAVPRDRGVIKRSSAVHIGGAQGAKGWGAARCPKGYRAISGGWSMTDAEETALVATSSRRVDGRHWATGAIQATSDSFQTDLGPTVYCKVGARRTESVSATGSVPSGETAGVDATCPKGRKAVAGGFEVPSASDLSRGGFPVASRRAGQRTWHVAVYAPTPEGATVTAYAYCAKRPGKLRSPSASRPTRDSGWPVKVRSRGCEKIGVRAGGFAIEDKTAPMYSIPISLIDSRRSEVWTRNLGGASLTRLTAIAYCH